MFHKSYVPNFFTIEDILATQERLPCKFEVEVNRLGYLDPSAESENINVGAIIELPYWLASALFSERRKVVTPRITKIYKESYREILKADPCVVDLHKLGIYFYEFGTYLATLDDREGPEIMTILVQTFRERFRQLMDWAQNSGLDPLFSQKLDSLERMLFNDGRKARSRLNAWLTEGSGHITAADMVVQHKKRKLADRSIL